MLKALLAKFNRKRQTINRISLVRYLLGEFFNQEARMYQIIEKLEKIQGMSTIKTELLIRIQQVKDKSQLKSKKSMTLVDIMEVCNSRFAAINELLDVATQLCVQMEGTIIEKPKEKKIIQPQQPRPLYPRETKSRS